MQVDLVELWGHMLWFAKGIVFVLAGMSIWATSITIRNWWNLRKAQKETRKFAPEFSQFLEEDNLVEAIKLAENYKKSHVARVLGGALGEVKPLIMDGSVTVADINSAERAVEQVESGMVLGFGTGRAAGHALEALAVRVHGGLKVRGVPSSAATEAKARALGLALTTLETFPTLDLTIDGADEVDPGLRLIKGGGGALLREKVLAAASGRLLIVVEASKLVPHLGATRGLPLENLWMQKRRRDLVADVAFMNKMVDEIIAERRRSTDATEAKKDMLGAMMTGVDRVTGTQLDDINIRYQINTFLIAGHETTSGLLSFAIYFLLKNPDVLARAYEEVDRVLGADLDADPTIEQVNQLTYIDQILRESLRLWPTAPGFTRHPYEDTVIGGSYEIPRQQSVMILTPTLHRDRTVWGEDADEFNPDHFTRERMQALPPFRCSCMRLSR